jgi:hypothetical protein
MNRTVEILHAIFERFKLRAPVQADVRDYILTHKRKAAVDVLRHYGEYGIAYGAALALFYGSRRLGIRLSMKKARTILAGATVLVFAAFITIFVIYIYYANIRKPVNIIDGADKSAINGIVIPERDGGVPSKGNNAEPSLPEKNVPASAVRYRLGVETFTGEALAGDETRRLTDVISGELVRLKGSEKVVRLGGANRKSNVNLALLGSVEKLGSAYIITAKIVDMQSGRVVASFDESAASPADVDAACRRVAVRAAGKVE